MLNILIRLSICDPDTFILRPFKYFSNIKVLSQHCNRDSKFFLLSWIKNIKKTRYAPLGDRSIVFFTNGFFNKKKYLFICVLACYLFIYFSLGGVAFRPNKTLTPHNSMNRFILILLSHSPSLF